LAIESGATGMVLMHGVQNFPTKIESLNIARLKYLKKNFPGLPCGYADHTDAEDDFSKTVDLIAVGLEANLIEKHITLDRSKKGIDYQAALEPAEYIEFVSRIHTAYKAFGTDIEQEFTESDLKYRKFQKKSIVAAKDLKAGDTINRDVVEFLRNDVPGIAPKELKSLIGKSVKKDIKKFQNIEL
jgi:N,N'-diacetyllegionaminate synthase